MVFLCSLATRSHEMSFNRIESACCRPHNSIPRTYINKSASASHFQLFEGTSKISHNQHHHVREAAGSEHQCLFLDYTSAYPLPRDQYALVTAVLQFIGFIPTRAEMRLHTAATRVLTRCAHAGGPAFVLPHHNVHLRQRLTGQTQAEPAVLHYVYINPVLANCGGAHLP